MNSKWPCIVFALSSLLPAYIAYRKAHWMLEIIYWDYFAALKEKDILRLDAAGYVIGTYRVESAMADIPK